MNQAERSNSLAQGEVSQKEIFSFPDLSAEDGDNRIKTLETFVRARDRFRLKCIETHGEYAEAIINGTAINIADPPMPSEADVIAKYGRGNNNNASSNTTRAAAATAANNNHGLTANEIAAYFNAEVKTWQQTMQRNQSKGS